MEFVNGDGIKYFIDAFKRWFINNINNWWKLLQLSHRYLDKKQWEYDVRVVENTDENTKKQYPLVPKLYFYSTDWIYNKWSETTSASYFPFSTLQAGVISNDKSEKQYTNNLTVNPAYGDIQMNGTLTSDKVKTTMNNQSILLADGSFKNIAQLSSYGVLETNIIVPADDAIYEYTMTNNQYLALNASGTGRDINFISDVNQTTVLSRSRRQYINNSWQNTTFTGKVFTDDNRTLDVYLYMPSNTKLRIQSGSGGNVVQRGDLKFI